MENEICVFDLYLVLKRRNSLKNKMFKKSEPNRLNCRKLHANYPSSHFTTKPRSMRPVTSPEDRYQNRYIPRTEP